MRHRYAIVIPVGILMVAALSSSCRKPLQEGSDQYIFIASNIKLAYWQEAGAGFMDAAHGLGVRADFRGPDYSSPQDELKIFEEAVAQHPSGILVAAGLPELFNRAINEAIHAGIPVITMDTDSPNSKRILYISTDNRQAGMESGRQITRLMNGKGNLVVITIPGQTNTEDRIRGMQEVLAKSPGIRITHTLDDMGDTRRASDLLTDLFKHKETVNGIVCLEASGGTA